MPGRGVGGEGGEHRSGGRDGELRMGMWTRMSRRKKRGAVRVAALRVRSHSAQVEEQPTSLLDSSHFHSHPRVETPIHDNIRELVTWECKEHGVKS
jgi:hypothetical protein